MAEIIRKIRLKDVSLLMIFNSKIRCKTLDILMPLITNIGSFLFNILFCLISIFSGKGIFHFIGIKSTIAMFFSSAIVHILKLNVNRTRPFLSVKDLKVKKIGIDNYSFPSGHTAAAFTLSTMLSLFFPSFAILFIAISSLVGISRMYLGVHYPSDVIVGTIIGSTISILVYFI